ncbi:hypothetical protein PVK73_28055 [Bacillus thuringiensis]|uniref:Zinc-finger domain-containing protein n=1 Tax=Bacillus thuringiensis TaxID=1428 RepID=A0A9W3SHG0_BACTU|nr:hypothetical protein [Bacillus thuringiensis]ANS50875.1 hypothetical protein BT246_55770 [Bacillus thuringiensis]MBH0338667.1 hypothetical protein [Bacillus thuringiensis]
MNGKEKRIRILDIQDQHCQPCEFQMKPLKECMQHCEVGLELKKLARELFEENKGRKPKEEWDEICRQAAKLYEQGFGTTVITKTLGCPSSTLREQLKKRGMWKGKTQAEIQEQSRKKWDDWCQQALKLRGQGYSYPKIAQYLGVPASNLRNEMSKRGCRL